MAVVAHLSSGVVRLHLPRQSKRRVLTCLNPRIIVNPLVPELLSKHHCQILRGKMRYEKDSNFYLYNFPYNDYSPMKNNINKDNYKDFMIVDTETGEFFDIYMEVPCCKCDLCQNAKVNQFVERCRMETQLYDSLPWFVTLTYDDDHLPVRGLEVKDVQKFLKRFRITLKRKGFNFDIRYCAVGEYGKKGRAHYHMIIWNINTKTPQEYAAVGDILTSTWRNGFTMHRLVDPKDDKAFYYTAKYLKKDCFVPRGCNGLFCASSRRNGGIGARFIDRCAGVIRRSLNINYKYLDKFSGQVRSFQWSPYAIHRIFPSFCRQVKKEFRDALRDFSLWMSLAHHRYSHTKIYDTFKEQYDELYTRYHKDFWMPKFKYREIPQCFRIHLKDLWCRLAEVSRVCQVWCNKIPSFASYRKLEQRRDYFLSKLFKYDRELDLDALLYRVRRANSRQISNLVLD